MRHKKIKTEKIKQNKNLKEHELQDRLMKTERNRFLEDILQ